MFKMLAIAIWASAITALASGAAARWEASRLAAPSAGSSAPAYEYRKTQVINVPVIADGALLGYVMAQFIYGINAKAAAKLNVSPDAFLTDYAFRALYGDPNLDFRHLEKYDVTGLTRRLKNLMNAKLGPGMVKDVLIKNFSYMPKGQNPQ